MAITREVWTEVRCDVCGEFIMGWDGTQGGMSKDWATYFARQEGAAVGKKVKCKKCRIKERMEKCSLQKKWGPAGRDGDGTCLGFGKEFDDEPIEKCKRCIACTSFAWEETHK